MLFLPSGFNDVRGKNYTVIATHLNSSIRNYRSSNQSLDRFVRVPDRSKQLTPTSENWPDPGSGNHAIRTDASMPFRATGQASARLNPGWVSCSRRPKNPDLGGSYPPVARPQRRSNQVCTKLLNRPRFNFEAAITEQIKIAERGQVEADQLIDAAAHEIDDRLGRKGG